MIEREEKMKIKSVLAMFVLALALVGCQSNAVEKTDETTEDKTNSTITTEAESEDETHVSEEEASKETVLRLAGSDTGLPNPFRHLTRGPGMSKMQLLYDSLLEKGEDGYIPWLASTYSSDESGLVYSFDLVENATWHDGTAITVDDVVFTFAYYEEYAPVYDELRVNGEYIVESVVATGDYSFDITLKDVDASSLGRIGGARLLPKHIWENVEDPYSYEGDGATVASGPYVMTEYDATKGEYRYEAYDNYWGLEPAVAAIEWVPASDQILAFENNEIDLINVSADLLARYNSDEAFTVETLPSYHAYRLMMNIAAMDELKQVALRQAMAYSIDREALVEKIARGSGVVSSMGYVPSNSLWYNPAIEAYDYNAEKGMALLDGQTYHFTMLTGNTPVEIKVAELIKQDLGKVGITVDIESVENKTRDQAVKTGEYELLLINSGGMGSDPDYLRSIYASSTSNSTALSQSTIKGYYNEALVTLGQEQASTLDVDKRMALIGEMQDIIAEDVPMIMLFSVNDNFVYRQDKYDGWFARFDHSKLDHNKLSYVIKE